jgi:chaperonin GroES
MTIQTSKIKPLYDKILVTLELESKTPGGIIIPDTAKDKPIKGRVVAVGSGAVHDGKIIPTIVQVGQEVLFTKWGGTEVKLNGEEYLILKESDILAIIE